MKHINRLLVCLLCWGTLISYGQKLGPNVLENGDFSILNIEIGTPKTWFVSTQTTRETGDALAAALAFGNSVLCSRETPYVY
jgi:hypothetical protein